MSQRDECHETQDPSDLKRIDETASCAISIHSSFLTIRDNDSAALSLEGITDAPWAD
jgi:hypothetical protein